MASKGRTHRQGRNISFPSANRETVPECVYTLKDVDRLDVSRNKITNLDGRLFAMTHLTVLKMNNNHLTTIPDAIEKLSRLMEIDLSSNMLEAIPDSVGRLPNLVRVNLSHNRSIRIPDSICECRRLVELNIRDCGLDTLPDAIGKLTKLQSLIAGENHLDYLPRSFEWLENLRTIDLCGNEFKCYELAFDLDFFPYLEGLAMARTNLEFPIVADRLRGFLRTIDYSHNNMGKDFRRFTPCLYPALVELDIHNSNIEKLPDEWLGAAQLRQILAHGNKIRILPQSLWRCQQLEVLQFQDNLLSYIPVGISNLSRLRVLRLDSNQFTRYPRETRICSNLEVSIDNNLFNTPNTKDSGQTRLKYSRHYLATDNSSR